GAGAGAGSGGSAKNPFFGDTLSSQAAASVVGGPVNWSAVASTATAMGAGKQSSTPAAPPPGVGTAAVASVAGGVRLPVGEGIHGPLGAGSMVGGLQATGWQ
ncbi:unnamed protein product, partial [Discosporangium mesarthrocarpum]